MATNTSYDPKNILDFEKSKLNKYAVGITAPLTRGGTTNIDYTLTDDLLIAGGSVVLVKDSDWGDHMTFQVLLGGVVINQFVTNWYVNPENIAQPIPSANYPAKLFAGLVLRIVYVSTAAGSGPTPEIVINYNFEKVLI